MGSNHEIRFDCTQQEKEMADKFYKLTSLDLKKSGFYKRIFLWGLLQLKHQAVLDNKDVLKEMFK